MLFHLAKIKSIGFDFLLDYCSAYCDCVYYSFLRNLWGLMISDEEIFASKTVQYHGQVIGALVCQSKEIGKSNFYFNISPQDGDHLKVS